MLTVHGCADIFLNLLFCHEHGGDLGDCEEMSVSNKVAVALSGGVDSSLTAALLLEQGNRVKGLTMKMGWGEDAAAQDAGKVARQLGIAHRVIEVKEEFTQKVLKPVVEAYGQGRTPNPCASCNPRVKFPMLWRAAQEDGCDRLATGHYARLLDHDGRRVLAEGLAVGKSQAYFLARLEPRMLDHLVFPLGELDKPQVRKMARERGLAAAKRPDSQEVCFLPAGGWDELARAFGAVRPGLLEDEAGRELARHEGLHRFTIGQRRGLGVALGHKAYVVGLDGERAAVTVGVQESLYSRGLWAVRPFWHLDPDKCPGLMVKIRYAHPGVNCKVERVEERIKVEFAEPQKAVAPGQLAVFYSNTMVVGSAWIAEPLK